LISILRPNARKGSARWVLDADLRLRGGRRAGGDDPTAPPAHLTLHSRTEPAQERNESEEEYLRPVSPLGNVQRLAAVSHIGKLLGALRALIIEAKASGPTHYFWVSLKYLRSGGNCPFLAGIRRPSALRK
jgi:hypothetical protein